MTTPTPKSPQERLRKIRVTLILSAHVERPGLRPPAPQYDRLADPAYWNRMLRNRGEMQMRDPHPVVHRVELNDNGRRELGIEVPPAKAPSNDCGVSGTTSPNEQSKGKS